MSQYYIQLNNISKRYGYNWIFRDVTFQLTSDKIFGISGRNGSGKSTLIKLLATHITPSSGSLMYHFEGGAVLPKNMYRHLTLSAPYTDIIPEFTLKELYQFHAIFKPMQVDVSEFLDIISLKKNDYDKRLSEYSSGMTQRVKLATAILSDVPLVLLDEPTSYLDASSKKWFVDLLSSYKNDRIIVIASNDPFDIELCGEVFALG